MPISKIPQNFTGPDLIVRETFRYGRIQKKLTKIENRNRQGTNNKSSTTTDLKKWGKLRFAMIMAYFWNARRNPKKVCKYSNCCCFSIHCKNQNKYIASSVFVYVCEYYGCLWAFYVTTGKANHPSRMHRKQCDVFSCEKRDCVAYVYESNWLRAVAHSQRKAKQHKKKSIFSHRSLHCTLRSIQLPLPSFPSLYRNEWKRRRYRCGISHFLPI